MCTGPLQTWGRRELYTKQKIKTQQDHVGAGALREVGLAEFLSSCVQTCCLSLKYWERRGRRMNARGK